MEGGTATPAAWTKRWATSLSMHRAEASTPAAHYGDTCQLQQALHRAVLPVFAMEYRKGGVQIAGGGPGGGDEQQAVDAAVGEITAGTVWRASVCQVSSSRASTGPW